MSTHMGQVRCQMTLVVEFYGGPCTGKSTAASALYTKLKEHGVCVEFAHEYVKRWAWEGREISSLSEYYLFGKQTYAESSLLGKVAVVVTDRPVLLSTVYASLYAPARIAQGIRSAVSSYYDAVAEAGHRRIAVRMKRRRDYDPRGRFEDADQAAVVDGVVDTELGQMLLEDGALGEIGARQRPGFIGLYSSWGCSRLVRDIIALTKS